MDEAELIVDKRELKRGSLYALRTNRHMSHDKMKSIRDQLNQIQKETGVKFILLGMDMEILEVTETA